MPMYEMQNCKDQHIESFFYLMKDAPVLGGIIKMNGETWKRVITSAPYGLVKGSVNPCSANDFVQMSKDKKGTIGDLMETSAELSEKRKKDSPNGRDQVQDKFFDQWSAKRSGKQHPNDTRPVKPKKLKVKK